MDIFRKGFIIQIMFNCLMIRSLYKWGMNKSDLHNITEQKFSYLFPLQIIPFRFLHKNVFCCLYFNIEPNFYQLMLIE